MRIFKHFNSIPSSDKEEHLKVLEKAIRSVGECKILQAPRFFHLKNPRYRLLSKVYYFALKNKGRVAEPYEMLVHLCGDTKCVSDKHLSMGGRNKSQKKKIFLSLNKILSKKWIV